MRLAWPWALWLLLPWAVAFAVAWRRRPATLVVADTRHLAPDPGAARRRRWPLVLEGLGALLLIAALGRPQQELPPSADEDLAVNVIVALDVSGSMGAIDLPAEFPPAAAAGKPSRLDLARQELARLLAARPHDRVGLVVFARRAYPACPLTTDHGFLRARLAELTNDLLEDGTDLAAALALGATQLRAVEASRQVLILVTDGGHNQPSELTPEEVAAQAAARGVTVHVAAVGSARAVLPVPTLTGIEFRPLEPTSDGDRLRAVATAGGGLCLAAESPTGFATAMQSLDEAERTRIAQLRSGRTRELGAWFASGGLLALAAAFILARTACLSLP